MEHFLMERPWAWLLLFAILLSTIISVLLTKLGGVSINEEIKSDPVFKAVNCSLDHTLALINRVMVNNFISSPDIDDGSSVIMLTTPDPRSWIFVSLTANRAWYITPDVTKIKFVATASSVDLAQAREIKDINLDMPKDKKNEEEVTKDV